jgi:hypothetical protein
LLAGIAKKRFDEAFLVANTAMMEDEIRRLDLAHQLKAVTGY